MDIANIIADWTDFFGDANAEFCPFSLALVANSFFSAEAYFILNSWSVVSISYSCISGKLLARQSVASAAITLTGAITLNRKLAGHIEGVECMVVGRTLMALCCQPGNRYLCSLWYFIFCFLHSTIPFQIKKSWCAKSVVLLAIIWAFTIWSNL